VTARRSREARAWWTGSVLDPFTTPLPDRHFEDYPPGLHAEYGPTTVTADEIVAFATAFDPQPMHVDAEWAAAGPFGGLIASGWHTTAIMMRLLVDHWLNGETSLSSPGVDELRWHRPVRPGDQLTARFTVLEARPSASRPDRGILRTRIELVDADERLVMSQVMTNFVLRRP